ncbi:MAG TPA: hypothetical protein VJY62_12740 [Bacteroidia bacterium]|nr:hypothetical protein [Bacteroidia bacterium]
MAVAVFKANGQLVKEKFDKLNLSENFDSTNSYWTTLANAENLFIVQEGEYILNRKSPVSPYAIMADYENNLGTFRLVTSIKLEKSVNDDGSAGIIFMAQPGGAGGFIFEINKLKQYRVRQIAGGSYKYITGDAKTAGWLNSKFINETNSYNLVEIKTSERNYDISLNNNFLLSFSEIEYKSGRMGIVIGAGTKARVDFLYLFSTSKGTESTALIEAGNETPAQKEQAGPDIIELTESIIKLKTQINKLTDQNEDLHKTLEAMKGDDEEAENEKKNLKNTIKELQSSMSKSAASYDSLLKVNNQLLKYKEMVAGNENSDLIITLSKTVKTEKEANELLRKQNKELTDSLSILSKNNKSNTPVQEIKPEVKPKQSTDKGFVLPKEGN